ncbi:MAG: hypothetical protein SGCHY_000895 [Lobulomycetales sp.]
MDIPFPVSIDTKVAHPSVEKIDGRQSGASPRLSRSLPDILSPGQFPISPGRFMRIFRRRGSPSQPEAPSSPQTPPSTDASFPRKKSDSSPGSPSLLWKKVIPGVFRGSAPANSAASSSIPAPVNSSRFSVSLQRPVGPAVSSRGKGMFRRRNSAAELHSYKPLSSPLEKSAESSFSCSKSGEKHPFKYGSSKTMSPMEKSSESYFSCSKSGEKHPFKYGSSKTMSPMEKSSDSYFSCSKSGEKQTKSPPGFSSYHRKFHRSKSFSSGISTAPSETISPPFPDVSVGKVPAILYQCLEAIEKFDGLNEKGLYRASGNSRTVERLYETMSSAAAQDRLDPGCIYESDFGNDVHVLTGVVKMWLRNGDPLIPPALYDSLVADPAPTVPVTRALLHAHLSLESLSMLRALCMHLCAVAAHAAANAMTAKNLSLALGPAVLYLPAGDIDRFVRDIPRVSRATAFMIEHAAELFDVAGPGLGVEALSTVAAPTPLDSVPEVPFPQLDIAACSIDAVESPCSPSEVEGLDEWDSARQAAFSRRKGSRDRRRQRNMDLDTYHRAALIDQVSLEQSLGAFVMKSVS